MSVNRQFVGKNNMCVSDAMKKIDENTSGILFIVDDEDRLVGCVTDGDIRRYLLSGGSLKDAIVNASNKMPKMAGNDQEAKKLYHSKNYKIIPIVDSLGKIIGLYSGEDKNSLVAEKKDLGLNVVINAGGKGTRLDPFTRILPKPLIPVGDFPIIELIMKEYQKYRCNSFHIIVNYKKEIMKAYFADLDVGYDISWYDEVAPLGTGGGLSFLRGIINETFFFANCDVLLTADYGDIIDFHKKNKNAITMVCAYKNISIPYGVVDVGEGNVIEEMREKPMMSFLTNTGVYVVEPEVLDDIEDGVSISFPEIIELERKKGKKVAAYPISDDEWMDMGQLPELEKMRHKLYGE